MRKTEVSAEEMKTILFEGLCLFRDICVENGLTYYLAFGTLLGAVRHQGYIPWDDDIDVLMPRKDYEKLLELFKELELKDWELLSYKKDEGYCLSWMKLCHKRTVLMPSRFHTGFVYGMPIDIFPLDIVAGETFREAKENVKKYRKKNRFYLRKMCLYADLQGGGYKSSAKRMYFHLFGHRFNVKKELLKLEQGWRNEMENQNCKYVSFLNDPYCSVWKSEDFQVSGEADEYMEFEGELFRIPVNYDAVLKESYGDYMQLPPEEKRVSRHTFTAYHI